MAYANLPVSPLSLPASFNFATDIVDYWAAKDPSQLAVYWANQSLTETKKSTYAHVSRQSHRIAELLSSLGVRQGDTCILILPRLPEWWEIATACLRSGVVLCPCTTLLVDKDIEYRLQVSQASVFIGDSVAVSKVLKIRGQCPNLKRVIQIDNPSSSSSSSSSSTIPSDSNVVSFHDELSNIPTTTKFPTPKSLTPTSPAFIFFTSGTTGPPKMVLHTATSYPLAHGLTGVHWLQLSPGKMYWNLSEQGWAKAAWSFCASFITGACLFVHDDRQAFNAKRTLTVLNKFPITTLCAPPTVYRQLVLDESRQFFASAEGRPRALEHCCGAGEPLNESVIVTWKQMTGGVEIYDGYGQTESILVCANQKENKVRPGSMGKPIPGVPLVVISGEGEEEAVGKEGDIAIEIQDQRKKDGFFGIFQGYINKETGKLDRRIKQFANGKQFYLTGDRATRDEDGYFWFVGRSDDVINSSGYRIGPFEVESTLKLHPSVVESAVVGTPDPDRDEVVKAFVVLTDSAASNLQDNNNNNTAKLTKELQDFCKQNAAPYKYPRQIEFVAASFLPKTISGKIKRAELKKLERERYNKKTLKTMKAQGAKL